MDNQPTLSETEREREEMRQLRTTLKADIQVGEDFKKLSAMPEFDRVFKKLYYDNGRRYLWENINHIEEELMKKARDEVELLRGEKNLKGLKRQVDARLVFKSFCDTVEHDHETAIESLSELDELERAEGIA